MDLTHFQDGRPRMVDVTEKPETFRTATAEAFVELTEEALSALEKGGVGKGDPLVVAQLAGILAAKKTVQIWGAGDLGIGDQLGAANRDLTLEALYVPKVESNVEIIEGDTPEEKARNLAQKLRAAKLI